ncbi:urea ABC transporter urea binding protein [Klebsiella variicola CAG:634]|nr:urea ABC transporter urea binding protein [Klebsiella variicola CAG:634]
MQRRTLLKAFALSASVMAMGLSFQAYAADTIKVGIMHSLSGTMAISETPLKDVALMAIDDINAKGGVLGKKLEPVVVDPASNWPLFAEKARQLLAQDKVAVVFGCWTSVSRKSVLGGGRPGLQLAAVRREGTPAAGPGQGGGGVWLLDLGLA